MKALAAVMGWGSEAPQSCFSTCFSWDQKSKLNVSHLELYYQLYVILHKQHESSLLLKKAQNYRSPPGGGLWYWPLTVGDVKWNILFTKIRD